MSSISALKAGASTIGALMMFFMALGFIWVDHSAGRNIGNTWSRYLNPVAIAWIQVGLNWLLVFRHEIVGPALEGSELMNGIVGDVVNSNVGSVVGSALAVGTSIFSPSTLWNGVKGFGSILKGRYDQFRGNFVLPEIPTAEAVRNSLPSLYGTLFPIGDDLDLNKGAQETIQETLYRLSKPLPGQLKSQAIATTQGLVEVMEETMKSGSEKNAALNNVQQRLLLKQRRQRKEFESSLNSNNDDDDDRSAPSESSNPYDYVYESDTDDDEGEAPEEPYRDQSNEQPDF